MLFALSATLPVAAVASAIHSSADVTFRAVLCFAPPFAIDKSPPSSVAISGKLPECAPSYRLTAKNLDVNVSTGTTKTIGPDPIFRDVPNSSSDLSSNVLLSDIKGPGPNQRYVLGPVELTRASIKSVKVEKESGQWTVSFTMTASGSAKWNTFAERQFHEFIAIVANGEVYAAPIIQPSSATFNSFGGAGSIAGNFTKAQARQLADRM
jgi:preprotein translocase subunit SecD